MAAKVNGTFNITTAKGPIPAVGKNYCRMLQKVDGHGYSHLLVSLFPAHT